jgi:hypothetical protein
LPNPSLQRTRLRSPLNSISLYRAFGKRLVVGTQRPSSGARTSSSRARPPEVHRPHSGSGPFPWLHARVEIISERSAARASWGRARPERNTRGPRASSRRSFRNCSFHETHMHRETAHEFEHRGQRFGRASAHRSVTSARSNSSLQRTRLRSPLNSVSLGHTFSRRLVYGGGVPQCQGARESALPGHGFPARFLCSEFHRPSSRQGQPSWRAVRA